MQNLLPASVVQKLLSADLSSHAVVVGFDAFIDQNVRIVGHRTGPKECTLIPTMAEFGKWATRSSGRSGGREYLVEEVAPGGCSLNLGEGLAGLGLPVDAFIGIGEPAHEVFAGLSGRFRSLQSLGMGPGRSFVLQFDDGKLILGNFEELVRVTPDFLRPRIAASDYAARCASADAIVFTCWSVYPHMTACWHYLMEEVLAGLTTRPQLFFDIADPCQRTDDDMRGLLAALKKWETIGPVTLSVNENEADLLAHAAGLEKAPAESTLESRTLHLHKVLGISRVVLHSVRAAASTGPEGSNEVPVLYCPNPVKTVGAGDRFNAGFLAGLLLGWPDSHCLALGNACSGFFVRTGRSATVSGLVPPC
jgi:hypothetical protein